MVDAQITSDFSSLPEKTPTYGGATRMTNGATLSLWPCDGSSRQRLRPTDGKLVVEKAESEGDISIDDETGTPTTDITLCISNANNLVAGGGA
eukprot:CAMPEP_0114360220 /NCGR_PEP_ID=MMETSP0101-20121206/23667_1 /TAXON_ID=38822 ORGANISM="Pteridomonas danica, Strain PT" /NCGR_SAMPLE_ID=MMETSP0101 /ASSEMBLY_ACC=CAM_ASM_000211 /LENGTH=92 /DNA_ID=CAMNT_0001504281 /DNA_START=1 /DNA_END=275 /DNA_ORIENTATION=-